MAQTIANVLGTLGALALPVVLTASIILHRRVAQ
jgi:hypothetical protein